MGTLLNPYRFGGAVGASIASATGELQAGGKNNTATLSTGAWTKIPLDTSIINNISGATIDLTDDEIDLASGDYRIWLVANFDNCKYGQVRLYNVTGATALAVSGTIYSDGGSKSIHVQCTWEGSLGAVSIRGDYWATAAGTWSGSAPGGQAAAIDVHIHVESI